MSTYIFALVVSDFAYAEADPAHFPDHTVRVYGPPELIERGCGVYSAEVSAKILQFLDQYFDAPYPLSKMDSVAVPQFSAGAMENYGLNLYRINLLIYHEDETLESAKYSVANVLAHELGHQNFGNLVTCKWWTNIWLNEGFATYVSYLAGEAVAPEFKFLEDQLFDAFQYSMIVDASDSTHPLLNDAYTPTEIDQYFSGITYEKGGSVIRMVEKFLTEQTLQKGLRYYLKDMEYKGAEQDDLFRNLQKAADEDRSPLPNGYSIKEVLDTWTQQIGYPLVRVNSVSNTSLDLTQEPFKNKDSERTGSWFIPVTVVNSVNPVPPNTTANFWINQNQTLVTKPGYDNSKWLMINPDATGYYRVLYDNVLTSRIKVQLEANATHISPLSRSQLLDDYFTFAFQGYSTIEAALDFTIYLTQEDHFSVWDVVFSHLKKTSNLLGGSLTDFAVFKNYLLPRITGALEKVGVEQSADHIGMKGIYRAALLDWACSMSDPLCTDYATKLYEEWVANPEVNPVPKDIQATMYCAIVATLTGTTGYDFIFEKYSAEPVGSVQKPRFLNALACSTRTATLQSLVNNIVDGTSEIHPSDSLTIIQRVAMNTRGRVVVFILLEDKISEIISVVGGGSVEPVGQIVATLSTYLSTQEDKQLLSDFIVNNLIVVQPIVESLQDSLKLVQSNMDWLKEYGALIVAWLNAHQ